MRMKKNCHLCKANEGSYCGLGYKTEGVHLNLMYGLYSITKPLEPCPKPKTIMQYIDAKRGDRIVNKI